MVKVPWLKKQDYCIDIGSAQTKVMADDKIIWQEPTCLSLSEAGQGLSIGQAAQVLLGKTPLGLKVVFPVFRAACVEENWFEQYLILLKQKIIKTQKFSLDLSEWQVHLPELLSPAAVQVWQKSCQTTLGRVKLISTSSALTSLSNQKLLPSQAVVVMIGDQSTGLFVINQNQVIKKYSRSWGMQSLLPTIEKVLLDSFQVLVNYSTLVQILTQVASVQLGSRQDKSIVVKAKSIHYQNSVAQIITSDKFKKNLLTALEDWLLWLKECLVEAAEKAQNQLLTHGVWLIGGGANLPGLSALVSEKLQCPVQVMPEPELAVVRGLKK